MFCFNLIKNLPAQSLHSTPHRVRTNELLYLSIYSSLNFDTQVTSFNLHITVCQNELKFHFRVEFRIGAL